MHSLYLLGLKNASQLTPFGSKGGKNGLLWRYVRRMGMTDLRGWFGVQGVGNMCVRKVGYGVCVAEGCVCVGVNASGEKVNPVGIQKKSWKIGEPADRLLRSTCRGRQFAVGLRLLGKHASLVSVLRKPQRG